MKKILYVSFLFFTLNGFSKKETSKDTLFVILDSRPETLDPRKSVSANGMRMVDLIFDSFINFDQKGQLKPGLAESWKLEGLTWILKLKANLKFSNGRPVTKEDILFSFKEFKNNSHFKHAFKNIESVEILENPKNQWTVKVTLKKFQAPFISSDLPVLKILPQKESQLKNFNKFPIGLGSWSVVKNNFRQITLKRNSPVFLSKPQFLSFQIIRDSFTRTQKMLSQEMDIAPSVLPLIYLQKFKDKNFNIYSTAGFSTTYLLLNLKNNVLNQKEVRQALALAINSKEIIKHKLYDYAVPAFSFIHPESFFFHPSLKASSFDLEKAKQIIQKLNLKKTPLKLSCSNNSNTRVKAKVLASQISQTGLKISVESADWGTFYKDVGQGAYDIALMRWVGVKDPDIYRIAFHSENQAPKGRNRSFYSNKNLDTLLEKALRQRDPLKRKLIYNKIQEIIAENKIVIPLWHDMEISVVKKDIENYKIRANGDFLSLPFVKK
ncbi:MAG: ABC transporter substrate-binding protein [Bdellovibrionales bacterium]|nr:ABC transporter substrate-binding protein [Bdellovibrionales bacterium]